jgi:hypothetical protein
MGERQREERAAEGMGEGVREWIQAQVEVEGESDCRRLDRTRVE